MNTGENLYLSSRVSAPIYDIGAWIYFITGSLDTALFSKYVVLTLFSASGLIELLQRSDSIQRKIPITKFLIYAVALASMMGHPLMMHEVGPMVLWYLFLTPNWVVIFLKAGDHGVSSMLLNWKTYALIILTIGSSDLFIFFYFPLFIFLAFADKSNIYLKLKNMLIGILILEIILIMSKFLYIFYMINGNNISNSGSWGIVDYIKNFAAPLLLSLFLPLFWGPVIIFLNFILLGMIIYFGLKIPIVLKKYLIIWSSMLLVLMLFGSLLHAIPFTREALPSGFRYHVAPWSILVISTMPIFVNDVLKRMNNRPSLEGHKNIVAFFLIIAILSLSNIEQFYSSVVPPGSKRIVDRELRKWITTDLPKCIKKKTSKEMDSGIAAQFVFLSANEENGRNDNLTILIENPWALDGRTFNQWRYSTSKSNYLSLQKFGLSGINTWAFTENNLAKAIEYSRLFGINHLVATTALNPSQEMEFLGECKVPDELRPRFEPFRLLLGRFEKGNTTYQKNLFVYKIKINQDRVVISEINSSSISYKIACGGGKTYILPTDYTSDLKVKNQKDSMLTRDPKTNLTILNLTTCSKDKIEVKIESQNYILYVDVFFLVFYTVLVLVLFFRSYRKTQGRY
jgi:hypothetical protein